MAAAVDQFRHVFPVRQLFRGLARRVLIWHVIGIAIFTAVPACAFLVISLLDTQGRVSLAAGESKAYEQLVGTPLAGDGQTAVTLTGEGLGAVAWQLRHRPVGAVVARLTQQLPDLRSTGAALFYLLAAGLLAGALHNAAMAHARTLAGRAAAKTVGQLRELLHRHALRTGISDLQNVRGNEILSMFTSDVEAVRDGIEHWIDTVFRSPLRLLVLLGIMLATHPVLAFECVVPLLFAWWLIQKEQHRLRQEQRLNADRADSELKLLSEGIHKSRLVRGYQLEDFEHDRFERHLSRYEDRLRDVERRAVRMQWLTRGVALTSAALVLFLVGLKVIDMPGVQNSLTPAEAGLLLSCLVLGYRPLETLAELSVRRQTATHAADRIYRFCNSIPEVGQAVGAKFLQPLDKAIEFQGVSYRVGTHTLLDGLDLKLLAGSTSAIVAFDPLEARTLVSLLPRFIEAHAGKVLIDGEDIAWVTLESLRAEVMMAGGSEPWLTGSVLENLTGGSSRYSLQQATEATKQAHAHKFIQRLPQGYETIIGQHGEQLTPGEGFRLALARAVLRDPAVLIIDEPASDELTDDDKALLDDACRRIYADRTVILLPRRITTLRMADRIVLLNRGRVEVLGTQEMLLQTSPLYRHWEYMHFNEFRRKTAAVS